MNKLFAIIVLILFASCHKISLPSNLPACVKERIRNLAKNTCGDQASATEYEFQGQLVYVLSEGNCPDGGASVINEKCASIGYLGGISGNMKINGVDFNTNAQLTRILWQD